MGGKYAVCIIGLRGWAPLCVYMCIMKGSNSEGRGLVKYGHLRTGWG